MTEPRKSRSLEREAARLKAKQMQKKHERGTKARKFGVQIAVTGGIAGLIAIVVAVVLIGQNQVSEKPNDYLLANNIVIGANLEGFTAIHTPKPTATPGVVLPKTPVKIVIVQDYQCSFCQAFENANYKQLKQWVQSGAATVEFRPISFLDEKGGSLNDYSKRAANSAYCVASYDPNKFFEYNSYLYANQPAEGTAGPEDSVLLDAMGRTGVTVDDNMSTCVKTHRFVSWIKDNTNNNYYAGALVPGTKFQFTGTPFVMVNGKQYSANTANDFNNPANLAAFVAQFQSK
ncbi:MAG: thioredoxin domain-containing protein [Actinomycetes bacterium]